MSQSITELPDQPNAVLANTWGKYREFAATSRKKKKRLEIWHCRVLILGIAGAVLTVLCCATGNRLEILKTRWEISGKTETNTKERNQFICNCKDAISIENSAWMAELTHKPVQENE
jgi:hypothetical protein